jgi:hypothetical protein
MISFVRKNESIKKAKQEKVKEEKVKVKVKV